MLVGNMRHRDPTLQALMANNALKMQGAGDAMVARKITQPFMKHMILYWLWHARASLLHKDTQKDIERKRKLEQLRNLEIDSDMADSGESLGDMDKESNTTIDYF